MAIGYVLVAVLAAAAVVFSFQNGTPVELRFLTWTMPSFSVAGVALAALAVGVIVAGVPMWIDRWRLRSRVRTLQTRVRQLETSLAERDRALLKRPSAPGPTD